MNKGQKRNAKTLDAIRDSISHFQSDLIQQIWEHFQSEGKWPLLRTLYRDHGKTKVRAALTELGGCVGREESSNGRWPQYALTLIGVLVTKEGSRFQGLMNRFFHFQRELFKEKPETTDITSQEIQEKLNLSPEETSMLGELLAIVRFGGGRSGRNQAWSASAMEEAEEFPENGDLSAEFERWLFKHYDYPSVVFEDQRRSLTPEVAFPGYFAESPQPSHSPEITSSLNRLRKVYPDSTKLGFLIMRFTPDEPFRRIVKVIKETAKQHGLNVVRADDNQFHTDTWGQVRTLLHGCSFGIVVYERIDREEPNANVGLEIGYLMAMNKPVLLLKDKTVPALQSDLAGKLYVPFDPHDPENSIPDKLTKWLRDNGIIVESPEVAD